jgi:hypothetical protein
MDWVCIIIILVQRLLTGSAPAVIINSLFCITPDCQCDEASDFLTSGERRLQHVQIFYMYPSLL